MIFNFHHMLSKNIKELFSFKEIRKNHLAHKRITLHILLANKYRIN